MNKRILLTLLAALATLAPLSTYADVRLAEPNMAALTNGLVGYWSMDGGTINWNSGTIQDLSGKGDTGNLISMSTTSSPVAGKIGGALKFNSSVAQEISLGTAPTALTFAYNQPFSIALWVKPSATVGSGIFDRIFSIAAASGQFEYFVMANNNALSFNVGKNAVGDISVSSPFTVGQWYHVVGVYDGTNVNLYVNGVKIGSSAYTYGALSSAGGIVSIGGAGGTNTVFNGIVDDVRVYNRVLSVQEVGLLYALGTVHDGNTPAVNSSFSIDQGGLNSGLVAYWPLDGNTTNWTTGTTADISGNSNTGTLVGMSTSSSPIAGKIGGALKFNGSTADIPTAYTIPAQSSATSFTWSSWVYVNPSGNSSTVVILGFRNGATWVKVTPSAFEYSSGSIMTYAIPTGQWLLLSVVKNGSNFTYYQNGVVVATASNSGSVVSHTFYMGGDPGFPGDGLFSGMLDDVRIYNRALTQQEVQDLYTTGEVNIGHSNTASGIGINSGLVGYWTFDGGTINWNAKTIADMSGFGETLTMNGFNTATTTAPIAGKIGQALKFNDSTQDLSHASISAFNFGTGDFSVSFWMKPASPWGTGTTLAVLGQKTGDTFNGWQIYQDSGHAGYLNMRITQQNNFLTGSTIPTGVWTYATFVRQGGTTYWYLNGVLSSSGTNAASISDTGSFYIGYAPTWTAYYPGALDDVRIYNRALSTQEIQQLYQMGR